MAAPLEPPPGGPPRDHLTWDIAHQDCGFFLCLSSVHIGALSIPPIRAKWLLPSSSTQVDLLRCSFCFRAASSRSRLAGEPLPSFPLPVRWGGEPPG
jgi:hypothetical protein